VLENKVKIDFFKEIQKQVKDLLAKQEPKDAFTLDLEQRNNKSKGLER